MLSGPQHSHLHLPGEAAGRSGPMRVARRHAGVPAGPRRPRCVFLLVSHLWGLLSAKERLNVCAALSWPRARSDCGEAAVWLVGKAPEATAGRRGSGRKMIRLARRDVMNLGDLKAGQSSELSAGNKGPGVRSSKPRISLSRALGARDQEPRHEWTRPEVRAAGLQRRRRRQRRQPPGTGGPAPPHSTVRSGGIPSS